MRTERVIAVFGGTADPSRFGGTTAPSRAEVLTCAQQLGSAVTAAGHVLLSGGTGPDDEGVKGHAIAGVGSARWVGVSQAKATHPDKPVEERNGGLVIFTGFGHKRNYLEASMCDAAVALPGGDGTVSEVTSALSLGRPVAFVGSWRAEVDLDAPDRSPMLKGIIQRTRKRFDNPTGTDGINARLAENALLQAVDPLPPYRYFELCEAQAVVEWIESVVLRPGHDLFEALRMAGLKKVARRYEYWLQ